MTPDTRPQRKRGRPTDAERVERRDEILDAAVRLFASEGFARVTFDRVAAEAHVTKRTIYNFFEGRNEIFIAAVERLRHRTLDLDADDWDDVADLAARIVHALHSDEAIALHRLMITEADSFPELAARFYADGPESYIQTLTRALRDEDPGRSEQLFALLLGETHRQRLLGLRPAPGPAEARTHANRALVDLGLSSK